MLKIEERLNKLAERLQEPEFLLSKGLGNEIGFHIFDYDPEDEVVVREAVSLFKKMQRPDDYRIREFDLYEVLLEILEAEGVLEAALEMEATEGDEIFYEAINSILNPDSENNLLVNYIKEQPKQNAIVFLTGIGKVWPLVRSHKVLNRLHAVMDDVPLVLFFPGTYTGQSLRLFNEFDDDNYYRAFRIVER